MSSKILAIQLAHDDVFNAALGNDTEVLRTAKDAAVVRTKELFPEVREVGTNWNAVIARAVSARTSGQDPDKLDRLREDSCSQLTMGLGIAPLKAQPSRG